MYITFYSVFGLNRLHCVCILHFIQGCQISVKKTKRLSIPNTKIGHKEVLTGFFVYIYIFIYKPTTDEAKNAQLI
jgi:hypothetical protein